MESEDYLKMSFDPNTIEHLGVKMYSHIPNAIAELVANSYDADSKNVWIKLYDDNKEKRIEVIDDGRGMDFEEVNNKFLRIGRNRRKEGERTSPNGRKVTGKKGLGKLALFGIGDIIEVVTVKEGSGKKIAFTLSWADLIGTNQGEYKPQFKIDSCDKSIHGTSIILKKLRRESAFDKESLAVALSKLFDCFSSAFKCSISLNDDAEIAVDKDLRFKNIERQFQWPFPDYSKEVTFPYSSKDKITGEIISTEKPLKPGLRGVTLFANGRLVNSAEFFGVSESSHGFSYLTGWLNVDFVDDLQEDVISTNRQSLNWELPGIVELRGFLAAAVQTIERNWRDLRREAKKKSINDRTKIDMTKWYDALPEEIRSNVEPLVNTIMADTEMPTENQADVIKRVHDLIPEYPYYHWRHIHQTVQAASKDGYVNRDYYKAFTEAVKRYINTVKLESKSSNFSEASMMGEVFGKETDKGKSVFFSVTKKYKQPDGKDFPQQTMEAIEDGQKFLSMGIVHGARNPLAHAEIVALRDSNLFNEKDCLDALSLLSHLYRRLDDGIEARSNSADSAKSARNP